MTRTYALHLPKRSEKSTTRSYGHKKFLSTWTELLLRTRPTHLTKHELLLEGSTEKKSGLNQYCTGKGSKVGSGGKTLKYLVAISYNVGVILFEEYEHMTGNFFASFIGQTFEQMFVESKKGDTRLFIQDNDPSQNSAVAKIALQRVSAQLLKIPPRSPDLNPIENMFKSVSDDLHDSAIEKQLERESFTQFKERVKDTIVQFPVAKINNLIESMDRRIQLILETKGQRLKY